MSLIPVTDFPKPASIGMLSNQDILFGAYIPAIDRIKVLSPDQFEDMIREWVTGFLMKNGTYASCKKCSGAGDMGRDVIATVDSSQWDNYQSKHYGDPLAPSEINSELGKLVYYTYHKKYTLPRRYYFVSPKGAGPKFNQLLENPDLLKSQLVENWDKHCKDKISSKEEIVLDEKLLAHLNSIDFSIFGSYDPQQLIDEHAQTPYHAGRFGGGLKKKREIVSAPPTGIKPTESVYINQLFRAYSEHAGRKIANVEHFTEGDEFEGHFQRQRLGFYSADSLNQFSRDSLSPDIDYFEDLKEEFYKGVIDVVEETHTSGFEKLKATTNFAKQLAISSSPLVNHLRVDDRVGDRKSVV